MKSISFVVFLIFIIITFVTLSMAQETVPSVLPLSTTVEDGGSGQWKATVTGDTSLQGFTIYRPQNVSAFGEKQKLPVVLWGNGACSNNSSFFKQFLNEIASNGYIVIAIGPYESVVTVNQESMRQHTKSIQLLEALNWITTRNGYKASMYFDKIDIHKVAVMGQSCGGLQALEVSTDPRVTTTIVCNSGIFNTPPSGQIAAILPNVVKDILQQLHGPVLYLMGGKADIAYANGTDDFSRITKVPAVMMNQEVGHGGTYDKPHGGAFSAAAVAWLNWQLKGDTSSSRMFLGSDCGFRKDTLWKVESKNFIH